MLLFAAVLWNLTRTLGTSPGIWVDTLIENLFVEDCLLHSKCTAVGAGATIGIFHSAGYFHWRSLLEWVGWRADGTYHVLLVINALGVVLVALTARRIGGRTAGAIAAVLMSVCVGVPTQLDVISDVVPMPFLGAVFTLLALSSITHPSLAMTATLGLVCGVTANCYATGLLLGVSTVVVGLMQPRGRWRHALVGAIASAASSFAISPFTWIVDARIVLTRTVSNANAMSFNPAYRIPLVVMTGVAIALWIAASFLGAHRRPLNVMAAIVLPMFLPLILGSAVGRLDPQPKYLAHVLGAACVCLAVPSADALRWLWQRIPAQAAWRMFDASAPYAGALIIAAQLTSTFNPVRDTDMPPLQYADVAAAERYLANERGWNWTRAARNLRAPDEVVRRAAIRWVPDWPTTGEDDNAERATLLKISSLRVPRPLPPSVKEVLTTNGNSTLVGTSCSWLDWRHFRACTKDSEAGPETCVDSGLPADRDGHSDYAAVLAGLPGLNVRHSILTLHFPLQPKASCPESWFHMPRLPGVCEGRIVSVDGQDATIEAEGRWARLKSEGTPPHEISMQWEIGGPKCQVEYRGFPPFFVEGDATTAAFLATIIERQSDAR